MRPRHFLMALLVPILLVALGTFGYRTIEGWPLFDALYMTVITLTTVGFGETHALSTSGRAFTIMLVLGGVFALFYAASAVIAALVGGELTRLLGRRRMEQTLKRMKDHAVICGYGRMGRYICDELAAARLPFVAIDRDAGAVSHVPPDQGVGVQGDATHDEILRLAGVERARSLITVVASDADNLYIAMSARLLNDRIFIVSRADDEKGGDKLVRGGADRVISPYALGAHRMAQAVLRPAVLDFLEVATRAGSVELQLEEARIEEDSTIAGVTLAATGLRQNLGIIIVAIRTLDGRMEYNPEPSHLLSPGDVMIALGSREKLDRFEALARGD